jgi:hypothetical protein
LLDGIFVDFLKKHGLIRSGKTLHVRCFFLYISRYRRWMPFWWFRHRCCLHVGSLLIPSFMIRASFRVFIFVCICCWFRHILDPYLLPTLFIWDSFS